jgi:hypothetical protein
VLIRLHLGQRLPDQPPYLGQRGRLAGFGRLALAGDLVEARFGRAQPPVALIPRDAIQAGAQLAGIRQAADRQGRDNLAVIQLPPLPELPARSAVVASDHK